MKTPIRERNRGAAELRPPALCARFRRPELAPPNTTVGSAGCARTSSSIRSIWLYTVVLGIVSIPVSLFGEKSRILHGFARFWSGLIMKIIVSPTKVTGLDKIDTSRPHVYAVNHASALDIPVLYVYLPFEFRILFKKELLSYPIVGWHLKRSGQICIDQQKPSGSIAQHSFGGEESARVDCRW